MGTALDEVSFLEGNLSRGQFSVEIIFVRFTLERDVFYRWAIFQGVTFRVEGQFL